MTPYILEDHLSRFITFFDNSDANVPKELFSISSKAPDLKDFPYPLPSAKKDYTCFAAGEDGVMWYGGVSGFARYNPNAKRKEDIVMSFSAQRDLQDNNVKALLAHGSDVWVLTETGVSHIEMKMISAKEKADILLDETMQLVERRGMVSQRKMGVPGDISTLYDYAHSDNDGCFTGGFVVGEIFHYATLAREKGENDPETVRAREIATKASEACLLLMHVHGRGDGFVARTYHTPNEPVPDDGFFYRKEGDKAYCVETKASVRENMVGFEAPVRAKVPDRLAKLYRDLGYDDDGIVYKADTSSDEITLHFLHMRYAYEFLAPLDPELGELLTMSVKGLMNHIIDNGYELKDATGEPTTWAKWSLRYFNSGMGWVDAPLNAAEVLMYLRITMYITGESGKWQEHYDKLVNELGYADLTLLHENRLYQGAQCINRDPHEELMYGDQMLSVTAFWGLIDLEPDEKLKKKYIEGYKTWAGTREREHNPGYDFPFKLSCPDEEIDMEQIATWFYRTNTSRLASGVNVRRTDLPMKYRWGGNEETSYLLPPDERAISKYDRNSHDPRGELSGGNRVIESCYVYTFAYWIGRYFGFIA